mgnify:CR=1 FL=1
MAKKKKKGEIECKKGHFDPHSIFDEFVSSPQDLVATKMARMCFEEYFSLRSTLKFFFLASISSQFDYNSSSIRTFYLRIMKLY